MRIALATTQVPFVRGGAELLAESLQRELISRGHEAELLRIPFNWYPSSKLRDCMIANSLLDFENIGGHPIDLVIGLKFPAYLAQHPNKVYWLVHQHRQAYEHWDEGISDLPHQQDGREMRAAIRAADLNALSGTPVYTISKTVSDRLSHYLDIASKPLYHPPPLADLLKPGRASDYVLVPSRLNSEKRQDLVLRGIAECTEPVRAIFVGAPDDDHIAARLRALAKELGVTERVQWRSNVRPNDLAALYSGALAVVFVPRNEDYGYVTLEAMLAGKPVLTVSDAGGPLEFISDGREGLITDASAKSLARSLARVWSDRPLAETLGRAALQKYHDMAIGWDNVVHGLLDESRSRLTIDPVPALAEAFTESDVSTERDLTEAVTDTLDASTLAAELSTSSIDDYDFIPDTLAVRKRAGVESIQDLFAAFNFGPSVNEEMARYLESHWLRYLQTADLLPNQSGLRVLDLGAVRPHIFLGLLKLLQPETIFEAAVEKDYEAIGFESFPSTRGMAPLEIKTTAFNVEIDRFPYADNTFDVVLAMEVVEHLALNPAHTFSEVARILRPGGRFIVTTPNIGSDMALKKIMDGHAPYSFGVFVPYHGVYGRHNREYTPREIETLGRSAGLSTEALMTKDVYLEQLDHAHEFVARYPEIKNPLSLRGQNIFYTGAKHGEERVGDVSPLYLENPFDFVGSMFVERPDTSDPELTIVLHNDGKREWSDKTLNLVISVISGEAEPGSFLRIALPIYVPPGETRKLGLRIAPRKNEASCVLMTRLERRGYGWLSFIGVKDVRFSAHSGALAMLSQEFADFVP